MKQNKPNVLPFELDQDERVEGFVTKKEIPREPKQDYTKIDDDAAESEITNAKDKTYMYGN